MSNVIGDDEAALQDEIRYRISHGDNVGAQSIYDRSKPDSLQSAWTHQIVSVAAREMGATAEFNRMFARARRCSDFTPDIEAMFCRDRAIGYAHERRIDEAFRLMSHVNKIRTNPEQALYDRIAEGRLYLHERNLPQAFMHFKQAIDGAVDLEPISPQLTLDANWWTLLAAAATRNRPGFSRAYEWLNDGIELGGLPIREPKLKRRGAAKILRYSGRLRQAVVALFIWLDR